MKHVVGKKAEWACTMEEGTMLEFFRTYSTQIALIAVLPCREVNYRIFLSSLLPLFPLSVTGMNVRKDACDISLYGMTEYDQRVREIDSLSLFFTA